MLDLFAMEMVCPAIGKSMLKIIFPGAISPGEEEVRLQALNIVTAKRTLCLLIESGPLGLK